MPNITGSFTDAQGNARVGVRLTFVPLNTPYLSGSSIVSSTPVITDLDVDGKIPSDFTIFPGDYRVNFSDAAPLYIRVPVSTSAVDFSTLTVPPMRENSPSGSSTPVTSQDILNAIYETRSVRLPSSADPDEDLNRFAVVGNFGNRSFSADANMTVATLLAPAFVISTGNARYSNAPYSTTVGTYLVAAENYIPAIGQFDYNGTDLGEFAAYFPQAANRYYKTSKGSADFFVLNSNQAEPDGVSSTSVQAQWLQAALRQSTAKWKIVVFHHAPYVSTAGYSSAWMNWPFAQWGANMVISGFVSAAEYLIVDNIPYIVCGNTGGSLVDLSYVDPHSVWRAGNGQTGFFSFEYNAYSMRFRFTDYTGGVLYDQTVYSSDNTGRLYPAVKVKAGSGLKVGANGLDIDPTLVLKTDPYNATRGYIIVSETAPDAVADPTAINCIWLKPGAQPTLFSYNRDTNSWINILDARNYAPDSSLPALPAPTVAPPDGSNALGFYVSIVSDYSATASLYYSIDGGPFIPTLNGAFIAIPPTSNKRIAAYAAQTGYQRSPITVVQYT